jgi:hypothetical protein
MRPRRWDDRTFVWMGGDGNYRYMHACMHTGSVQVFGMDADRYAGTVCHHGQCGTGYIERRENGCLICVVSLWWCGWLHTYMQLYLSMLYIYRLRGSRTSATFSYQYLTSHPSQRDAPSASPTCTAHVSLSRRSSSRSHLAAIPATPCPLKLNPPFNAQTPRTEAAA